MTTLGYRLPPRPHESAWFTVVSPPEIQYDESILDTPFKYKPPKAPELSVITENSEKKIDVSPKKDVAVNLVPENFFLPQCPVGDMIVRGLSKTLTPNGNPVYVTTATHTVRNETDFSSTATGEPKGHKISVESFCVPLVEQAAKRRTEKADRIDDLERAPPISVSCLRLKFIETTDVSHFQKLYFVKLVDEKL